MRKRLLFLIAVILTLHLPALRVDAALPGSVDIALKGVPQAVIVVPDNRGGDASSIDGVMWTQSAAQLVEFLHRITGADFKTVRCAELGEVTIENGRVASAAVPSKSYILVGESDLAHRLKAGEDLAPGAMLVQSAGNVLTLTGPADGLVYAGGTFYAVHSFLESLGVCYLWPGELGLVVPHLSDISVPYGSRTFTPTIKQRNMRMILGSARALEGAKDLGIEANYAQRILDSGDIHVPYVMRSLGGWLEWQNLGGDMGVRGGHAFGDLWEKYGAEHPGWFALQPDGTRRQKKTDRAQLCLSNSELVQHIADDVNAKADADPGLLTVPLGLNDGGEEAFCMCKTNALGEPGCTTYDPPEGRKIHLWGWDKDYVSLTDRYIVFANRVAEKVAAKHPKLLLVVDAYSLYGSPPVKTRLHPNLVVRYVPSTLEDWDAWSSKAGKIFWRPNTLSAPWRVAELKFNRAFADDLHYAAQHSTIATDFDSVLNNWATEGLNYYLLARLNFDPDASVDEIVDDYCRKGFRAASTEIRAYFKRVDELTALREARMTLLAGDPSRVTVHPRQDSLVEFFTPQVIAELRALLEAAAAKVGKDGPDNELIRHRIAFLRVGLDWTDMQARAYALVVAFKRNQPVDLVAAGKLLNERRAMMLKIFREEPLAVNVAYLDYADRGYWQPLLKAVQDGAATRAKGGETMTDADENGRPIIVPKL